MYRKYFFISFVAAALLAIGSVSAYAQATSTIRGKVLLKQADGTTVPVANAVVDLYRLEVAGKQENIKTNKRGEFQVIGLFIGGKYILSVSAPNAAPKVRSNIKVGLEEQYQITLDPGNGQRYSMEEAKNLAESKDDSSAGGATTAPSESAEAKADREEKIRKNAEMTKKVEDSNALYNRAVKEGNEAYLAKRFDEAIAKYSEAITADPDHPGAPVVLTNRSIVLRVRAVDRYNESIKNKDAAAKEASKKDLAQAFEDAKNAVIQLKAQGGPADQGGAANYKDQVYRALMARAEVVKYYVPLVDRTQATAGLEAYQEYIASEPDAAKKSKAELDSARMLFDLGEYPKAIEQYQKIIATNPEELEASLYLGLALFNTGEKANFQEAANQLQRFVDKAPDTHEVKASAKEALDYLKSQENVKPQKGAGGKRKG